MNRKLKEVHLTVWQLRREIPSADKLGELAPIKVGYGK